MKINIAIILVAGLLGLVGVAGADSQGPTDVYGDFRIHEGNLSYTDSGSNVQEFDFNTEPSDGDIFASISNGWAAIAGKYLHNEYIIGPASDTFSIFYDATTDQNGDEIEINSAVASGEKQIILLPGIYHISSYIYINQNGVSLQGSCGQRAGDAITIYVDSATSDAIRVAGNGCLIEGLAIRNNTGTIMTSGAGVNVTGIWNRINRVCITNLYVGLKSSGMGNRFSESCIIECSQYQVHITGSENYIHDIVADSGESQAVRGLYVSNVGNFYATASDFIRGGSCLYLENVHAALVSKCYFDTGNNYNYIISTYGAYTRHISLVGCWFAGRLGSGSGGELQIYASTPNSTYDVVLLGCQVRDTRRNGVLITNSRYISVAHTKFNNLACGSPGAVVALLNSYDCSIIGNTYHGATPTNTLYGISWNGAVNRSIVSLNNFYECDSWQWNSPSADSIVENNQIP